MKILIATPLYPPDIGGPATYSKKIADELPKRGISVDVLSFGDVRHFPKIIRHLLYLWKVFWRGRTADIIFAQDPVSVGMPAACAAFLLRKPYVVKIVGDYAWEQGVQRFGVDNLLDEFLAQQYGLRVSFLRALQYFSVQRARRIIVPSNYLKSVVVQWGVRPEKISVIYNDIHVPLPQGSKDDTRKRLGIPQDAFLFFSAGRLVPWKGFEMLIGVMRDIAKQYPKFLFYIAGDGPQYKYLINRIYASGLENNIFLLGALSHSALLTYIRSCDIFLFNTGYEGFSHQLLEAFSAETPVITTIAGGNREIVRDDENSIFAEYNNHTAWESAIKTMIHDPALRARLSRQAQKDANRFLGNHMVEELVKTFKNL